MATNLAEFIKAQSAENVRVHGRIDETAERSSQQVGEIKEAIASRGRVSGRDVLALLAVVCSVVALLGGVGHSYVTMRMESLNPRLDAVVEKLERESGELVKLRAELTEARVESAYRAGQAEAKFEVLFKKTP